MRNIKYLPLVTLLFTANVFAVAPTQLNFNDGETKSVTLSDTNINRIQVQNDLITHVQCPQGFCTANQYPDDQSGSVYLSVNAGPSFSLYLDTQSGRHLSLQVNRRSLSGQTILLIPNSPAETVKAWESSTPYDDLLITLMKGMISGELPDGYAVENINQSIKSTTLDGQVSFTLVQKFAGDQLQGMHYSMQNLTKKPLTLSPQAFYKPGIRAVAVVQQTLQPNSVGDVYLIEDR